MFRLRLFGLFRLLKLISDPPRRQSEIVVFVCEHGSAESIIAAELFNRAASRHDLAFRALYRGVKPDPRVMDNVRERLFTQSALLRPAMLSPELSRCATLIVSFTHVPSELRAGREPLRWPSSSVSDDYTAAEQAISRQVLALLSSLAAERLRMIAG